MFVLVRREPKPDASYWPGRRLLAAVDAVAWPFGLAMLVALTPATEGLVRPALAVAMNRPGFSRHLRASN